MSSENPQVEQFITLFMAHQRRLYHYLLTLVGSPADAEDLLQETSLVIWRKFDNYEPGTNFTAWAFRIAHNLVLNHRARSDDELLSSLADHTESLADELDARHQALAECLERLPERDRDLIERRYEGGASIKQVAEAVGRPVQGMYKAMRRIHDTLHDCIERKLADDA